LVVARSATPAGDRDVGIYIDPAWEYWEPDPEIAEVLHHSQRLRLVDLMYDWRMQKHRAGGIRFGNGNPDGFGGKLAPKRLKPERESPRPAICKGCGRLFQPDRFSRKHCSSACYKQPGRDRVLPDVTCEACGVVFRPREAGQRFCNKSCFGKSRPRLPPTSGPSVREIDTGLFTRLYLGGASRDEIMDRLGISEKSVKRWRARLNLPARPSGNHSRSKLRGGI
jgi:hypothetical protein